MRTIKTEQVTQAIAACCINANLYLPEDIKTAINKARAQEDGISKEILSQLIENYGIAENEKMPVCQDTGMTVVFAEVGQDVHFTGVPFEEAIQEGVRKGYAEGYLRKSVVKDPILRGNTGDNTPPVIHTRIVPGETVKLTVAPKGFGSENMSALAMLKPSDGREGVVSFIVDTVRKAGSNPCPPVVVGVGIGGTMEKAALLAKQALMRPIDQSHPDPFYAELEAELLSKINALGIGPSGLGGKTTALGVNVLTYPTHIAGLPVAVNMSCHVTRHQTVVL